jgi:hypothetical protein
VPTSTPVTCPSHALCCAVLCRGDSFHFAHRFRDESLKESIRRHEYFLALKLHLTKADKASACLPACLHACVVVACHGRGAAGGFF